MPKYRVQTSNKTYEANVETTGKGNCKITLENRNIECTCDRGDEIAAWSLTVDGSKTHAKSRSMDSDRVEVWVGGLTFQFSVLPLGPGGFNVGKASERSHPGDIRAIMPGRITSIMVKPGEEVSVGTPLLILEAMKMQNEINSPKSGRVTSIRVREGLAVKKDSILIEIE